MPTTLNTENYWDDDAGEAGFSLQDDDGVEIFRIIRDVPNQKWVLKFVSSKLPPGKESISFKSLEAAQFTALAVQAESLA